jgi:K+/H+ antiporter YhaU regulatory subunit KhtT
MSQLQDSVNELVKYILEYETDYWSKSDVQLSKEEAENMAAILIGSLIDNIEDTDIEDAYNEMYEPPDNPDPLYIHSVQARWTIY